MYKLQAQQRPVRKLLGAIIAAALFLPDTGYTLGLGEIEVNSALNQKLNADIELLSATAEETETLIVKLASRKEFSRAGLDRPFLLNDLRFKSIDINGSPYIKISSGSPIREPFLNFLVEIEWPNGRLLREYTVLLDPPVFMSQQASAAANITPANVTLATKNSGFRPASGGSHNVVPVVTPTVSVSHRPVSTVQLPPAPAAQVESAAMSQANRISAPVVQQQRTVGQPAGSYKIKSGDTAWRLADSMRPDQSVTVTQMMIAMLRENRESFINGNINGLKRGYILRVPDYHQITSISHADAMALVREQTALWRQYQQSQASGQPVSKVQEGDASVATRMATDMAADSEDDAYLEIVTAGSGRSVATGKDSKDPVEMTAQELRAELSLARERVETELVEKEALQQRVDTLQQNVEKMKGMLAIEDAELAAVQSLDSAEGIAAETVIDEPEMQGIDADENIADVPAEAELDKVGEAGTLATLESDEVAELAEEGVSEEALFVDETRVDETGVDETLADIPEQTEVVTDDFTAQVQLENPEPADPLTQLLNNPMLLAAAGGGLLLFVALIGLIVKRRKAAAAITVESAVPATKNDFDDLESLADDLASEDDESEKVKQAVVKEDIGSAEEPVSTEPEASVEAGEEDPRDDVIAEADVYLAYGIYQQAEELLTQAIADNPERDDYRVKLAETHYTSKNTDAFVDIASDIKQRVANEDSPAWKKVLSMGQDLCADHPLFLGGLVGGLAAGSLSLDSSEKEFDLNLTGTNLDEIADTMSGMPMDGRNVAKSQEGGATKSPDLDSDLNEESQELPELVADTETASPVDELEFDLSDVGAVEESSDIEEEFSLDIDASELSIDIKDDIVAEADDTEESLDLTDLDLTDMDMDLHETADDISDTVDETIVDSIADVDVEADSGAVVADKDIAIDLTEEAELLDIDLSEETNAEVLEGTDADAESTTLEVAPVAGNDFDDEEDFDLSKLDDVDEISTKLDLARAYLDMGDHEGTKGILEEVLADGNDEQKQEASELMEKMG